ncbi:hypothetical protein PHSY_006518 [Pseudozyma hubeiensis SY62]|uniref:Uncharacterized protein n=1 Tax=Pseudozyma hubeiensis (strain SY62) TaxID=1305764 RepID=R9PBY6_PSEHS|nr:hypothetical protein PHSY_006518 [Pseudozyma hubeiensis SY62]GAC98923.1 hypothetical protein PHSY_006518 [Pseudozyma hubeiensis SY62]
MRCVSWDVGRKSSCLDEVGRGCFVKSEQEDLEETSECKRDRGQPSQMTMHSVPSPLSNSTFRQPEEILRQRAAKASVGS